MKIITTSIIVVLISTFSFGQLTSSVDILVGLDQSYRSINDGGSATELARNDFEIPKLNYHIGLNYNKLIVSKLNFKTGLRFVSMGYKTEKRDLLFPTGEVSSIQFVYDYLFLEIPLGIRYQFVDETVFSPYLELGFSPTIYLTNRAAQIQDGEERIYERIPLMKDFNTFQLSANVAAGVNYSHSAETDFFLQFNYRSHLSNLVTGDLMEKLNAYGIELGLRRSMAREKA